MRALFYNTVLLLAGVIPALPVHSWTLVEDFEGYESPADMRFTLNTDSVEAGPYLLADPTDPSNQVLHVFTGMIGVDWANTHMTIALPEGTAVGPGEVATLYWRAYEEGTDNNWMIGMTEKEQVSDWGDYRLLMKVTETSNVSVYHNRTYQYGNPPIILGTGVWNHFWLAVDYDAGTFQLWCQRPEDPAPVQLRLGREGETGDFTFRSKPAGKLNHFSITSNSESPGAPNSGQVWYLDDFAITAGLDLSIPTPSGGSVVRRTAKSTITPVELDIGDALHFTLRNGETRVLKVVDSGAEILLTNIPQELFKQESPDHGVMYRIWIDVLIDGQPMRLSRYLCSQYSFCEPWHVNGMRIWFEYNRAPLEFMTGNRGGFPEKEVRIVVNDMTDRIAPDTFVPWYRRSESVPAREFARERIDARDNYKGDDMHMGGYFGATPHNGLDINMPRGTQMIAPIDLDDQFIFSNANRWRGIRQWDNGSEWWLQSHHTFRMVIPEYTPLQQGTQFAEGAGTATGEVAHSHFMLRVIEEGQAYPVDAWLIFWQTFRDLQDARGDIRAVMAPVSPAVTGEAVPFSSAGSRSGSGEELTFSWSFGDGGTSTLPKARHVYANPGIYSVRLTVDDGEHLAHFVQSITVSGEPVNEPVMALSAPREVEFQSWPVEAGLVYGEEPGFMAHTLRFTARSSRPVPEAKRVHIVNNGTGTLSPAQFLVHHSGAANWLKVECRGKGNEQFLVVSADATGLPPGTYHAKVAVQVKGAANSEQRFRVRLNVEGEQPEDRELVMLNSDAGFYATPWFWAPHSFTRNDSVDIPVNLGRWDRPMQAPALLTPDGRNRMGLSDRYLTNGYRAEPGQFFRFTPDLAAGTYQVSTPPETPWDSISELNVRVRHAGGEDWVRFRPGVNPVLGEFAFNEGRDGFVEFHAGDSVGQVSADALVFRNVDLLGELESAKKEALEVGSIPGLVAYWSFDDKSGWATDSAGGHSLEFSGPTRAGPVRVAGRIGDGALRMSGEDGPAIAGPLGLDPASPRTISAWIRLDQAGQTEQAILLGFSGVAEDTSLFLGVPRFGNRIVMGTGNFAWTLQSNRDTEWHHFVITWDGENLCGYLDGTQTIRAGNLYGKPIRDHFQIGDGDAPFSGAVDELRVYARCLDPDEVKVLSGRIGG